MKIKKVLPFAVPLLLLAAFAALPFFASAQTVQLSNPLQGTTSVTQLIQNIIKWLVELGAPVAVVMIIWGAFQMLFSGGKPESFESGKNAILYAVAGYGIIVIGWGIVSIIQKLLQ